MPPKFPIRSPNFAAIHPNEAAFEHALGSYEPVAAEVERHLGELGLEREEALATFDPRALDASEGLGMESFSIRRFSDYVCGLLKTTIVPAAHGRIENLLITVPTEFDKAGALVINSRHERHYKALIAGLGGDRKYTVVCHPNSVSQIQGWFAGVSNVTVDIILSPRFYYSIWGQDAYVAAVDAQGAQILTEGVSFSRDEDMTLADDIAAQSNVAVLQSYLFFEGGNVLGGPKKTLIGADYIWRNTTRADLETEAKVVTAFEKLLGTDIVVLGGLKSADYAWLDAGVLSGYGLQPIFHLDMYVTPTGVIGTSGKEIVLLGRPKEAHRVTGKWAEVGTYDDSRYDEFFEETEVQLEQHFEVQHLPLLLTYGDLGGTAEKRYYNLSFNNVVIENYSEAGVAKRRVVMTTYSEDSAEFVTDKALREDLEQAAESVWKGLGFTVEKMDGMEDLAYGDGSVHCITKALKRGPAP